MTGYFASLHYNRRVFAALNTLSTIVGIRNQATMNAGKTRKPQTYRTASRSTKDREAFGRTKRLLAEVQPDIVNVSKFFSRPRTAAEKMASLSPEEVKRRSKEIAELSRRISLEKNRAWMGWEGTALFDERGKGESWMGRNFAYKPVVVKGGESLVGRFVPVRVVNAFSSYLEAELV